MANERGVEFGLFFQLPQAAGQSAAERYSDTIEQVVEADRLGFDLAWLAEMHFLREYSVMPSPMVVMAAAAARTSRIRLGTGVVLVPLHNPLRAAEEAATLDIVSGGRLEYGIGRGTINAHFDGLGIPVRERAERFDEGIDVILRAWRDEPVSFHGRFWDINGVDVVPKPVQKPHPPLCLAANSDESFARAIAERWRVFASPITAFLDDLDRRFAEYHRARTEAEGAEPPLADVGLLLPVYVSEDGGRARDEAEESIMSYLRVVAQTGISAIAARGGDVDDLPPLLHRYRHCTYDEALRDICAVGSPDEVAEKLTAWSGRFHAGHFLTWFNCGGLIPHERVLGSMRLFAEQVAPRV